MAQPLPDHLDHGVVEAGVEVRAAGLVGVVVPAVVAAVGVQVAAELDEELEGERGAGGEGREGFDGREERQEGGCKGGRGEVRGDGVLEAVEVAVEDGHFAVDVVVEGLGGGRVGVHGGGDAGGDVCSSRWS